MENATNNAELMDIFYEETQGLIDEMRQDMSTLSQGAEIRDQISSSSEPSVFSDNATADESSALRRLFRCAHIIKSSSRSVGFDGLGEIAEALEKIFNKTYDEDGLMEGDTISLLCESVEACGKLLNDEEVVGHKELLDRLNGMLQPFGG
jgi:chemotaxis protein histidine kinase CheA